ncbi:hypothetical protein BGZ93_001538 [Podila epicladia]|nr:hypothetical protein BGZ92_008739 [Podila epicladia]KAG0097964.1 hypothetical protein BGZ93_001538 [Podila epicladia]
MAVAQGSSATSAAITAQQVADMVAFESERARLVSHINVEMSQVISNINILNRHLETIITIGQEFDHLSNLWSHFNSKEPIGDDNDDVQNQQ